jgi:hypothetical protein
MAEAGSIWIRLGLNTDDLRFGVDKAKYALTELRDETNSGTKEFAKWGTAIGATVAPVAAAGAVAYAAVQKYGAMANSISDLATTTGLSTRRIQELQRAAVLSNTDFSRVTTGVNRLTLAVGEAGDESSAAARAFSLLGVALDGRSMNDILQDTIVSLNGMSDGIARNEAAMAIFGKSWTELIPLMQTYVDKASEIQGVDYLTDQQLSDLQTAKSALDSLGQSAELAGAKIVAFFARLSEEGNKTEAKTTVLDRLLAGQSLEDALIPEPSESMGSSSTGSTVRNLNDPDVRRERYDKIYGSGSYDKKMGTVKGYASGGVVPGAKGEAQLAVVHGGERVIPNGSGGGVVIYQTNHYTTKALSSGEIKSLNKQAGRDLANQFNMAGG